MKKSHVKTLKADLGVLNNCLKILVLITKKTTNYSDKLLELNF